MRQEILVLLYELWTEEYINKGLICRGGEWWTAVTVVCELAALCSTGIWDISKILLSLPGSSMKTEAEIRACVDVVYLAKSPQESGERDWDEGNWEGSQANEGFNTEQALWRQLGLIRLGPSKESLTKWPPKWWKSNSYSQVPHRVLTPSFFLWHYCECLLLSQGSPRTDLRILGELRVGSVMITLSKVVHLLKGLKLKISWEDLTLRRACIISTQ